MTAVVNADPVELVVDELAPTVAGEVNNELTKAQIVHEANSVKGAMLYNA
jgi:hypothetical protein